uniref:Defective in cullin neddylation protein n=1 Tax=Peronospora matthiolae TaxID=2874970 RepID=A0AAV1T8M0_9STRA
MDLSSLRVKDLTEICRTFGIRTSGRKAEIVERIKANARYQSDVATMKHHSEYRSSPQSGTKRSLSATVVEKGSTKKKQKNEGQDNVMIDAEFARFLDLETQEASITDEGILAFCDALGVDAQDPVMLALSCAMEAETMGIYTRTEFRRGMHKLQCRSIEELRGKIPCLRSQMQERAHLGTIYAFAYGFSKDPAQKSLALELAIELWDLLLPGHFYWHRHWIQYVRDNSRSVVPKDLWLQVLDFGLQINPDLSNYDENGAWPVLLDEFAAHMLELISNKGLVAVQQEESTMVTEDDITDSVESMLVDD